MGEREPAVLGGKLDGDEAVEDSAAVESGDPEPGSAEQARLEAPEAPPESPPQPRAERGRGQPEPSGTGTGAEASARLGSGWGQTDAAAAPESPRDRPASALARRAARPDAPTFHVAGFWRRLGAAGIDLAIVVPVSLALAWVAGQLAGVHLPPSRHRGVDFWLDLLLASDPALVGALGLTLAIATVYVLVFQITIGRTPGMKVLKTRIIDVYGDPPSTGRAAARTAGYLAGVATLGLGFLWVGFDSEKRGLHDWISGSYVVKA